MHAWSQALAWLITSAFWIVITCGLWLIRGRGPQPTHFPEIPGDTTIRALTRPIILYAVIRAVTVSAAAAIAFGLHLPTNFATEGKRVLFTFAGVGIAAIVMLLADRLQKRQTPAAPTAH